MAYAIDHMLGSQRNGLNHVLMEMGDFNQTSGPVRGSDYPTYTDALLNWYQARGVKSVRLTFTWEALQTAPKGPVPAIAAGAGYANYWTDLTGVITRLLARGIYVTLAMWQFNKNLGTSGDTDIVYHDAAFSADDFADFWHQFAAAVNGVTGGDQRVGFDLINEPHTRAESGNRAGDIGISLSGWFACAQAAITSIRTAGAKNTIFVPGMGYTAASSFIANGSAAAWLTLTDPDKNIAVSVHCYSGLGSSSTTVLRDAHAALVNWARAQGVKVATGEIAINAGNNGRPVYCSTFSTAQAQWADWKSYCIANDDVLVGWNWWANSAAGRWNQGDSCDSAGFHWALTVDDGATKTIYMNLIEASLPAPALFIRDDVADTGSEPNVTTTVAWESPDVSVRPDKGIVGDPIRGGQKAFVYVSVTNNGAGAYDGNDIVRLYWAKAQSGLSWPAPWDGLVVKQGGMVAPPQPVGAILPGQSKPIEFEWPTTPNPVDYGNDGHFCLLAFVTKATSPEFEGFQGPNLNQNVLNFRKVAWHNIHIVPVAEKKLGDILVANHTGRNMATQIAFEVLDASGKAIDPAHAKVLITAGGAALEKLRHLRPRFLEDLGDGTFRVLDVARGIPHLDLRPKEVVPLGLSYVPDPNAKGYAVRATQFSLQGDAREIIGGQTFVAGAVDGFTDPHARRKDYFVQ